MKDLAYPQYFFDAPFADSGSRQIIPESATDVGRASLMEGFPVVTQLPLEQGGVAPNRLDFNGILHMLSAFSFWQQSGGQWTWSDGLNYKPPCMTCHEDRLWWCTQASGPGSGNGVKTPGTDTGAEYWQDLADMLGQGGGGGGGGGGNPVGTVIMYHGATAPEGYLPCNGSAFSASAYPLLYAALGKATTPDMRGLFVRGYDPTGVNDAGGAGRALGSAQGDAMQPITGSFRALRFMRGGGVEASGALYGATYPSAITGCEAKGSTTDGIGLDSSRVTRTAAETRPKNINLLYCIKHD